MEFSLKLFDMAIAISIFGQLTEPPNLLLDKVLAADFLQVPTVRGSSCAALTLQFECMPFSKFCAPRDFHLGAQAKAFLSASEALGSTCRLLRMPNGGPASKADIVVVAHWHGIGVCPKLGRPMRIRKR